jgi:hypothetical protein
MELYHVSGGTIPPGQVLRPYRLTAQQRAIFRLTERLLAGDVTAQTRLTTHRGQLRRRFQREAATQLGILEAVFEQTRRRVAPALPTRLGGVFAWPTLALAHWFRDAYRPDGVIHGCRLLAGEVLLRDATLIGAGVDLAAPLGPQLVAVTARAERYWTEAPPGDVCEVLARGVVAVLDHIR